MYCCSWIYSKVFPYKVLKKEFPKNPFLIKTFCYRNCTLYAGAADILLSLSILLEILSEFNIGYWINFIVSCIFWNLFFFQLIDHGSVGYPKILGKSKIFLVNLRNSIQTQPVPNFFGTQTQLTRSKPITMQISIAACILLVCRLTKNVSQQFFSLKNPPLFFLSIRKMVHI